MGGDYGGRLVLQRERQTDGKRERGREAAKARIPEGKKLRDGTR